MTRSPISRLGTFFWTLIPPNPPFASVLRCGANGLLCPPPDDVVVPPRADRPADHVEPVRLYEAYLRNFEIESGRGTL